MNLFKATWGFLFRLFPCPTETGLRKIGNPSEESPVLVTCNFYTTVQRLSRALRGQDVWLLVAESRGVNVWCAACGNEFNTRSVVSAIKTSGIEEAVSHRTVILPPLGAAGISAREVEKQTGWHTRWGPVRARDIPAYLNARRKRTEAMKRATYTLVERLDTALGSLFPFYSLVALAFLGFAPHLLGYFLLTLALTFLIFFGLCPWIPGKHGWQKVLFLDAILGLALAAVVFWPPATTRPVRTILIMAMLLFALHGGELGGLSSTWASDFDPLMARLGLRAIGNTRFAGTTRTDLLIGARLLTHNTEDCSSCGACVAVCPLGVWDRGPDRRVVLERREACTACCACLTQCPEGAITAQPV